MEPRTEKGVLGIFETGLGKIGGPLKTVEFMGMTRFDA